MNKVQTIILKFVAMMSFIAMVFSFCKIDADAIDWGPTNSNRYLIQNLGSNADILDIVEYLDANWFYGIKLCETPYSDACSSCLSLQGTDQSIKNKIEEHMRPGKNGGMNCTGLVGYVYRKKGADLTKITQIRKGWYINATNWHNTASGQGGIANAARTYRYNTIQEMLSAKKAIKGDLIFFEPKNWYASGADCHIGFYWGNYPGHDQFLHNSTHPNRGAQITTVTSKCDSYVYVIKSAPSRITFDKNTTDTVTNMPANGKKYMNSPFIFPNQIPKREGYTFKGWDRDKNNTSGVFPGFEWWIADENQTVYAIWEKNKNYNVKYVVDGDKQFTKTMEQEVDKNYTVLSLTDIASTAAKTGYTFSNWECNYYASESNISTKTYNPGDTYKNLSSPGTTATFTSKWKANKYTIKYNANGGSGTMSSQSATYDQNVTLNQNKFTKTGYTFLGWSEDSSATTPTYTDRQTVKNLSATNGATVNLYAVWHKNAVSTYLIRFNANGGSGSMSDQSATYDQDVTLSANKFKRDGYKFVGWATSSYGYKKYDDEQTVRNLTTANGSIVTLYAVWNDIPGVDVDDIYIFKDEKDKVTTEFVEAESNLRIKKNNSETNVLEYHNTNIDDIKADLDADKDETTVKFDVIYNTGYETTATCKLYVIDIVHKDSALARVRYIDDAQYISESSVWSNSTMNTILRNALGVKENMDDIPSTEVEKADTTS